jgi:hypothetical protein
MKDLSATTATASATAAAATQQLENKYLLYLQHKKMQKFFFGTKKVFRREKRK